MCLETSTLEVGNRGGPMSVVLGLYLTANNHKPPWPFVDNKYLT
jgi:hypothetical protein